MADLIAQGPEFTHRWRRRLTSDLSVVIGRHAGLWSTPWDDHISRQHISVHWDGKQLAVEQLASARNPIFLNGTAVEKFELKPGGHFVVGNTTFTLSADHPQVTLNAPQPDHEQSF